MASYVAASDLEASFLSAEQKRALVAVCEQIGAPGKGITACDESGRTINPRFEKVGVAPTEERRRAYRQMLFEAPGCAEFVSGAILDPETVYQKSTTTGLTFPATLAQLGIACGVKPSLTVYTLPGTGGETVMQGLDSLSIRCAEYKAAGCVFAKWRAPLTIDAAKGQPSPLAIDSNMRDLARYALICQEAGLVPIVEPDVVLAGAHTLEAAIEANVRVWSSLFRALTEHGVFTEGVVFKVNLVNPGKACPTPYSAEQIAEANLNALRRTLPVAVGTVNYLSGGQSLADATARLDAINRLKAARGGPRYAPWNLSFSWSAAIQLPLFELCRTEPADESGMPRAAMQALYVEELKLASDAALGRHKRAAGDGDHKGC